MRTCARVFSAVVNQVSTGIKCASFMYGVLFEYHGQYGLTPVNRFLGNTRSVTAEPTLSVICQRFYIG